MRGWFGASGPTVHDSEGVESRLVYVNRRLVVHMHATRRYTWWWVRGVAFTVRVGRLQVQWL